uniref:DUF4440 domain-containing protein n=1 Tax=mine drainage metagenome TaxID=410659 RepID=E6QLD4_9ZZZZ
MALAVAVFATSASGYRPGYQPDYHPSVNALPRSERHEYHHAIIQLEHQWRAAMLSGNTQALGNLLSDDYIGISSNGVIQTRDETLASLSSGALKITGLTISERKIRLYGGTAVVTSAAEVTGKNLNRDLAGRYRYSRVYVRNPQGQWKIVSFEASLIREPK